MERDVSKQQVIEGMQDGYGAWLAALARVPLNRMTEPGAVGTWTLKDVIAHIASGHRWLAGQLEADARRELPTAPACLGQEIPPPPEVDMTDNQQRNEWYYEQYRAWPLEDVQREAVLAFDWLTRVIEALPESTFSAIYTIADYSNMGHVRRASDDDDFRFPLWSLIHNATWEHYPAHIRDLQAWLEQ
jgi:hypothetical protein